MQCREVKKMLFTDYFDSQLSDAKKKDIEAHLSVCKSCEKLKTRLFTQRAIFKREKNDFVPQIVWHNIVNNIEHKQTRFIFSDVLQKILFKLNMFKPAIAGCLIVIIAVAVMISKRNVDNNIVAYALLDGVSFFEETDSVDFGSVIEEYFL